MKVGIIAEDDTVSAVSVNDVPTHAVAEAARTVVCLQVDATKEVHGVVEAHRAQVHLLEVRVVEYVVRYVRIGRVERWRVRAVVQDHG